MWHWRNASLETIIHLVLSSFCVSHNLVVMFGKKKCFDWQVTNVSWFVQFFRKISLALIRNLKVCLQVVEVPYNLLVVVHCKLKGNKAWTCIETMLKATDVYHNIYCNFYKCMEYLPLLEEKTFFKWEVAMNKTLFTLPSTNF